VKRILTHSAAKVTPENVSFACFSIGRKADPFGLVFVDGFTEPDSKGLKVFVSHMGYCESYPFPEAFELATKTVNIFY
jgi:hypothetical protein